MELKLHLKKIKNRLDELKSLPPISNENKEKLKKEF